MRKSFCAWAVPSTPGRCRGVLLHAKPQWSGEGEAKFWLTPTVYLADSDGFDARTLRDLRTVVAANKDLIERTWNEHFA